MGQRKKEQKATTPTQKNTHTQRHGGCEKVRKNLSSDAMEKSGLFFESLDETIQRSPEVS